MSPNRELHPPERLQSVLIIGCGLMGTSLALALCRACPNLVVSGVETNPQHRRQAAATHAFHDMYSAIPADSTFDLAVLATPLKAATALLPTAASVAYYIMDLCSVKSPMCESAIAHDLTQRFAPTHPMAGTASSGPAGASAQLYEGCTWITVAGWPACTVVAPLLAQIGAVVVEHSAREHDLAMSAVSHGVHVTSLSAMLAYRATERKHGGQWAGLTGPGFRDVTRLSASGAGFWPQTLVANKTNVLRHLTEIRDVLQSFITAVEQSDEQALNDLLEAAKAAHQSWTEERQ